MSDLTTITSNEQDVRLRIYEGDLQLSDAASDLVHLALSQLRAEKERTRDLLDRLHGRIRELEAENARLRNCDG